MHLTIGAPEDIIVYPGDVSAVHLRATHADWSEPIYKVLDSASYEIQSTTDFSHNWVDASFVIGMDISFASSYENSNGRATTGDDEIYPLSKARWSAVVSGTIFDAPGQVSFDGTDVDDQELTFNWTATTSNNGSAVAAVGESKYRLQLYELSSNEIDYVVDTDNASMDIAVATNTFSGLDNGKFYKLQVTQLNRNPNDNSITVVGESKMSDAKKPGKGPSKPTGVTLSSSASQTIDVEWVKPDMNGYAFVRYDILLSSNNFTSIDFSNQVVASADGTTTTVDTKTTKFTGLTNGTLYKARVKATNALEGGTTGQVNAGESNELAPVDTLGAPTEVYALVSGETTQYE
jgi:hypothetical protein